MRKRNKNSINLYLLGFLFVLLSLSLTGRASALMSCLPTCSSVDGRFIVISEGATLSTFTPDTLNVRLRVPAGSTSFSIGVFDGDNGLIEPGTFGFWDVIETPFLYTLRIDPDGDNLGPPVFEALSGNLPTNDWADFTLPVHPSAMDENGDFLYVFTISHLNDNPAISASNAFKLRSSGTLFIDEIFSFKALWLTGDDVGIVFPNFDFSDGVGPEDAVGSNYDGTVSFFFEIPEGVGEISEIALWDADCDHGNYDGTDLDTDDPNTPNTFIPAFVPMDSDAILEGVNAPSPFDDKDPNAPFGPVLTIPGAVKYTVIFPDGQEFVNDNPSGDREWEKFSISTVTDNPLLVDFQTSTIPTGLYEVRFEGLDLINTVAIRPPLPFTFVGEIIPDEEITTAVPTISEWGLIALAAFFGIIGALYSRRYRRV